MNEDEIQAEVDKVAPIFNVACNMLRVWTAPPADEKDDCPFTRRQPCPLQPPHVVRHSSAGGGDVHPVHRKSWE